MRFLRTNGTEKLDGLTKELENVLLAANRETEKLARLRESLADAERGLSDALATDALTGGSAALKVQENVAQCRAAVDAQNRLVSALRCRAWTTGTSAAAASVAAYGVLDAETEKAAEAFRGEWLNAAQTYAVTLARRAAMERLLGRRLQLPDAKVGGAADVHDLLPTASVLAEVYSRISQVTAIEPPSSIDTEESALLADFTKSVANLDRSMDRRARQSYELGQKPAA